MVNGAHLAVTLGVVGLHQAGVVEVLGEEHLRRGTAAARALRLEELAVALGDADGAATASPRLHLLHSLSCYRHRRHVRLLSEQLFAVLLPSRIARVTRAGVAIEEGTFCCGLSFA